MGETGGEWFGLSSPVPKRLKLALKIHCAKTERKIQDVVAEALREKLAKVDGRKKLRC